MRRAESARRLAFRLAAAATAAALVVALVPPAAAQTVSGRVFEDRNGNGLRDAGEPDLPGVPVRLFGQSAGGAVDQTVATGADGTYAFAPGDGCYLVAPLDPPGWRPSQADERGFPDSSPGYAFPIGVPRYSKIDLGIANLAAGGTYDYASIGDSIAWNFNICGYPESFWYSKQVRSRLACAAPAASVVLHESAIKGEHTDDLLVDDGGETNNVFRLLELQPELVTISMIGNDLLDVDEGSNPSQAQVNTAVTEVLDARQNLQEVMSTLLAELPSLDIALNTLYDNEAYNCYSGAPGNFHRTWIPIVNRILRDLAWGQARRAAINEVAAEFAQEDQLAQCTGFDGMICRDLFQLDTIHPTNNGFTIVREKVWEGVGGVTLGSGDALGRGSIGAVDHGYLRRVRRLSPRFTETRGGATVEDASAALSDADGGAPARIALGAGAEEFRLSGFPDWFDEIRIARVVAGVRYRTDGAPVDDFYRIEASTDDVFRAPPGHAYTPTDWNFFTPIVGGGGPNQPASNPDYGTARVLATPSVAAYRDKSALLSKNPELPPGSGVYVWPAVTHEELATATVRVAAAPVAGTAGNETYRVELDHAWLDLYGWEVARPAEVETLRVDRAADGTLELTFDPVAGAQRYNVYAGTLAAVDAGVFDHGESAAAGLGPTCDATTAPADGGRLQVDRSPAAQAAGDVYFLVTAHVDDVESPAGRSGAGVETDRSQSVCR